MTIAYLASPHAHFNPIEVETRAIKVRYVVAELYKQGYRVYSPILHCHEMAVHHNLQAPFEFWEGFDKEMISRLDEFWLLIIDGWSESKGMRAELAYAQELGKPVRHVYITESIPDKLVKVEVGSYDRLVQAIKGAYQAENEIEAASSSPVAES